MPDWFGAGKGRRPDRDRVLYRLENNLTKTAQTILITIANNPKDQAILVIHIWKFSLSSWAGVGGSTAS